MHEHNVRAWRGPAIFIVNVLGAIVYARLASNSWAIPAENGLNSGSGEAFIRALYALPVLATFGIINLIVVVYLRRRGQLRTTPYVLAAEVIWILAMIIDFSRH